jgi:hypothetical protein
LAQRRTHKGIWGVNRIRRQVKIGRR